MAYGTWQYVILNYYCILLHIIAHHYALIRIITHINMGCSFTLCGSILFINQPKFMRHDFY